MMSDGHGRHCKQIIICVQSWSHQVNLLFGTRVCRNMGGIKNTVQTIISIAMEKVWYGMSLSLPVNFSVTWHTRNFKLQSCQKTTILKKYGYVSMLE